MSESDIFTGEHADAAYAIGPLSGENVVASLGSVEQAYAQLRANVYIDQKHLIEEQRRGMNGGEYDENDERSVHFVVAENRRKVGAAIIAAMRVIPKTDEHPERLPVEELFDGMEDTIGMDSVEFSRFIVRHTDRRVGLIARSSLFRSVSAYVLDRDWNPCVATVETELQDHLERLGAPTKRLTGLQYIDEYNTYNMAIDIDVRQYVNNRVGDRVLREMQEHEGWYYQGKI